jgi:hypothetical protein
MYPVRIDPKLRDKAIKAAKNNGTNLACLFREFLVGYIEKNVKEDEKKKKK